MLVWSERYQEAERAYDKAVAEARRRGSSVGFAAASSLRSRLHYRLGRLSEAEADAIAALDLRDDVQGSQGYLAVALNALVFTRARAQRARSRSCSRSPTTSSRPSPPRPCPYGLALHARGWLRAALGDPEGGLAELLACGEREQQWGVGTPQIVVLALGGGRGLPHARPARAGAGAGRRGVAAGAGDRRAAGDRGRVAGRGAGRVGRAADSAATEAVETLERSEGALELARARVDLGARAGARGSPRPGTRSAARRPGARVPLWRHAARRARPPRAAGHRRPPAPPAAAGRDGLTPSERRVTQMAAEGMTNREIAQALFVTEKTVETHLGRAFVKLGVRSRKQLAAGARPRPR